MVSQQMELSVDDLIESHKEVSRKKDDELILALTKNKAYEKIINKKDGDIAKVQELLLEAQNDNASLRQEIERLKAQKINRYSHEL